MDIFVALLSAGNVELVQTFHLLLCCFTHVLKSTPSFLLKPPYGMYYSLNSEKEINEVNSECFVCLALVEKHLTTS